MKLRKGLKKRRRRRRIKANTVLDTTDLPVKATQVHKRVAAAVKQSGVTTTHKPVKEEKPMIGAIVGGIAAHAGKALVKRITRPPRPGSGLIPSNSLVQGATVEPGADIEILSERDTKGRYVKYDETTGRYTYVGPRRRRRRLLTASDKSDIAFLRGTLGGGELGRAAITALLSKRST